jgi:hypothetical protein
MEAFRSVLLFSLLILDLVHHRGGPGVLVGNGYGIDLLGLLDA